MMLKRYKGNDGEPPFSQLTDITKVNFHDQFVFSERNAMASSEWHVNVFWDVMRRLVCKLILVYLGRGGTLKGSLGWCVLPRPLNPDPV